MFDELIRHVGSLGTPISSNAPLRRAAESAASRLRQRLSISQNTPVLEFKRLCCLFWSSASACASAAPYRDGCMKGRRDKDKKGSVALIGPTRNLPLLSRILGSEVEVPVAST
jgi:hypothetical protein